MYRYFASLCAENETLDADEVANVHQTLEHSSVESFVLLRADVVASDIHLDAALRVLKFHKACLAHHAAAHHAASDDDLALLVLVLKILLDVL